MPLSMGQVSVPGNTTPTAVLPIPTGSYSMVLYNTSATTIYLGSGSALTSSNGLVMHSVPTAFTGFQGEAGTQLWALNTTATAVSFNYILSYQM